MNEAVIVATARTPIGRANKGSLVDVDAFALAEAAVAGVLARAGVDVADIDDLVLAESLQGGGVIARHTAVRLGLNHVPGLSDNRHCAAGLSAVQIAAGSIMAGMDRVVIAGGTESLSSMPQTLKSTPASARDFKPWMSASHPATPDAPPWDMSITVGENTAREVGISRHDADEWAVLSHQRAAASVDNGWFDAEIVPVDITNADGTTREFTRDEHPRRDTTMERLAGLAPLHPEIAGSIITAGNAAGLNDAAAAVMVTSGSFAAAHGLGVQARILAWASVGVDPARTGMGPVYAIPKALERAGLTIADIDLFEVNEAFTPVTVAAQRRLGIGVDRLNVNGSGCGLGHPIAATGARMVVTMIHELERRGGGLGCVSMCAGGGMGSALILQVGA